MAICWGFDEGRDMVWFGVHGKFTVSGEDEVGDKVHV
jgi:hypothetical protein